MLPPPQPKRPTHIPDYAEVCLAALVQQGLGDKLSLGARLPSCTIWIIVRPMMWMRGGNKAQHQPSGSKLSP